MELVQQHFGHQSVQPDRKRKKEREREKERKREREERMSETVEVERQTYRSFPHLPPKAVLLVEYHEDVSLSEGKPGVLGGDESVLARVEVKVSSEVGLCQSSCLLVARLHLDH